MVLSPKEAYRKRLGGGRGIGHTCLEQQITAPWINAAKCVCTPEYIIGYTKFYSRYKKLIKKMESLFTCTKTHGYDNKNIIISHWRKFAQLFLFVSIYLCPWPNNPGDFRVESCGTFFWHIWKGEKCWFFDLLPENDPKNFF